MSTNETSERMTMAIKALVAAFPGCAVTLLIAPFNGPEGSRTNYVSNVQRADMIVCMKEVVARFEGRVPETPWRPQ